MPLARDGERLPPDPRASGPGELPASAYLRLDPELQSLLERADRALCRLGGAVAVTPDDAVFVRMQLRCEAVTSCLLDGERASLSDLLAIEAGLGPSGHSEGSRAAVRCLRAMEAAMGLSPGDPVGPGSLEEIVGILQGGSGATAGRKQASQGAPSPRGFFREILDFQGDGADLPPIVRVGIAHARAELAGPFGLGAGRVGRLLAFALLHRSCGAAIPLSAFLHRHAGEYRDRLKAVVPSRSWAGWIGFFVRGVVESAEECVAEIGRVASLREEHRKAAGAELGYAAAKGLLVLDRMIREPLAAVVDVQKITGTSYVAANTLVSRLAALEILEEATGHRRNRVFLYGSYVRAFGGPLPDAEPLPSVAPPREAAVPSARPRRKPPGPETRPSAAQQAVPARPREERPAPPASRRRTAQISDHLL